MKMINYNNQLYYFNSKFVQFLTNKFYFTHEKMFHLFGNMSLLKLSFNFFFFTNLV